MKQLIDYKNITLKINNSILLQNTDFELFEQQIVFLTGKVGSGKTSLLKSIYAEIPVLNGKVLVLNYNLKNIKNKDIPFLRRQIGYIFQDFVFLNDRNNYQNLKFVLEATGWTDQEKIQNRIDEVLQNVSLEKKAKNYPFELSGGEQQRLALARAMINNPKIILADEPTANLDTQTAKYMMDKFAELAEQGTGIIIVTHDDSVKKIIKNAVEYKIENKTLVKTV